MANEDNLIPVNNRTKSEQREIASSGGKASGEKRRKNKSIREALVAVLKGTYTVNEQIVDGYAAMAISAFNEAMNGNIQAFNSIRDTVGEKPTDKVNLESGANTLKQIKISFVDKSTPNLSPESDPKIIGEYTNPIDTEDGC